MSEEAKYFLAQIIFGFVTLVVLGLIGYVLGQ